MPAWAENSPRNYWEGADVYERANGRLFKQIEFALPRELSQQQQVELAASFCADMARTKDGPLPYSFAVHKGRDEKNPHCHLLISERVNDGHFREPDQWFKRAAKDPLKGGAKKTTELHPREWLLQCRELWAERANLALQRAGHEARIDHRSLEAQGINRAPTIHLGPSVAAMERKGIRTPRGSRLARAPVVPQAEKHPLTVVPEIKESAPIPAPASPPTTESCRDALLAIAKQGVARDGALLSQANQAIHGVF
jgi:ATP-dependent exoDNAse (exonuclease V) alpha subunit